MKVIGIDGSLTACGLSAVDFQARRVVDWECIRTKPDPTAGRKTDDLARRLTDLSAGVTAFLARNKGVVAMEAMTPSSYAGKSSLSTVGLLMASYGAIFGCLQGRKPIVVMPHVVKARVTGRKDASKQETWDHTAKHFTTFPTPPSSKAAREAVQDATAVALSATPEVQQLLALTGA